MIFTSNETLVHLYAVTEKNYTVENDTVCVGEMEDQHFLNTSVPIRLPDGGLWPMVISLVTVMVVGILGNILTLVALPYVKIRYGQEFSVLQTSYAVLLLHLSLCDLLYCIIGFPHYIQVYIVGYYPHSETSCWWMGMIRNLVAYTDFSTIAVISICACRHRLCRTCYNEGRTSNHGDHDNVFGGNKIFFICICIWFSSFVYMATDIFNITGTFGWSHSLYGCNAIVSECSGHIDIKRVNFYVGVLVPLVIIVICYGLVGWQLWKDRRITEEINPKSQDEMNALTRKYLFTLFILALAYVVLIIPGLGTDFMGSVDTLWEDPIVKAVLTSMYFWVYGINFIIYVLTNKRLRAAYFRSLRDLIQWSLSLSGSSDTCTTSLEEPSNTLLWWGKMKDIGPSISQSFSRNEHNNSDTYDTKV